MDTLAPKTQSNANSDGNSTQSSSMELKTPKKCQREQKLNASRSRSFLHCISKHLGRHFLHHHHHHRHDAIYSSQDDIHSSSTDSFSLSFDRASRVECHIAGSSIDLTSEERTSRASSASACSRLSPAFCPLDNGEDLDVYRYGQRHIYVDAMYRRRPVSSLERNDELSSEDDEDQHEQRVHASLEDQSQPATSTTSTSTSTSSTSTTTTTTTPRSSSSASKGLHLSRISISSSVSRMLHHFSSSASTRSLSCSNTPLRRAKLEANKPKKSADNAKTNGNKSACSTNSSATNAASINAAAKKKEKKQQSILRPPIHYVYMKGMSGLYSRVPRYTVCCPYAMQQIA